MPKGENPIAHCAKCGHENRPGRRFCAECGSALALSCPKCGAANQPGEKFCGDCAAPLTLASPLNLPGAEVAQVSEAKRARATRSEETPSGVPSDASLRAESKEPGVAAAPDGERKTITALFADIKGSMELMEDLDPEEARAIIDPALNLMMESVRHYGGFVAQSTGDGIFALFGAPIAHEDHPQRAAFAALRMQQELDGYSAKLRAEGKSPLSIRVGLNTGEVVVRSVRRGPEVSDYLPVGHSTGLAERMQSLAKPGAIVVSEHTHKLIEGYFQSKPLGPTRVKGLSELIKIYEVVGIGPVRTRLQLSAHRGLSRFVGRQAEMEQMKRALELASSGRGQIVAAVGEPGVGKSRLFYEFKAIIRSQYLVLETFSVSHGKASPYIPVVDLLRNYFELKPEDDERRRREKVGGKVLMLDRSLEDTMPYLFALLGLVEAEQQLRQIDPEVTRRRTLEGVKRLLFRESVNQPLVVVFEDLHWLDGESQALLDLMVDSLATAKILLLVNYRPEYRHGWGAKTYYTQLRLDPLGKQNAEEMLTTLLGDDSSLLPVRKLVAAKTEGNPFFMEEMVQALFDQGALVRNGNIRVGRPITEAILPPTVQGILASRIDRLAPPQKDLLQTLAVLGKEFPLGLVTQVAGKSTDELGHMLSSLQEAEFIYEQPAFPQPEYTFKHALTQEVAYGSMLLERRKALHQQAGEAIERLCGERVDDHLDELAIHYRRSGNVWKALEYLRRAGEQSAQRAAFQDAISQLTAAMELLKGLPDDDRRARHELAVQLSMGVALTHTQGFGAPERERAFLRAQELCSRVGSPEQQLEVLSGLESVYRFTGRLSIACDLGERSLALAEKIGNLGLVARVCNGLADVLARMGEFTRALELMERAIQLRDSLTTKDSGPRGDILGWQTILMSWLLWSTGFADRSLERMSAEVARARTAEPYIRAFALFAEAQVYLFLRNPAAAIGPAEAESALANEHGIPHFRAVAILQRGWALAELGRVEEGLAEMRRGHDAYAATGAVIRQLFFVPVAAALAKLGQLAEALKVLDEALQRVETTGDRMYESELCRLKGELLLQGSAPESEAEQWFRRGVEVARHQRAKSLELRATTSLACLLAKQGKRDEARTMLADIYNWFTEGFDTADLKDAKALLEELKD